MMRVSKAARDANSRSNSFSLSGPAVVPRVGALHRTIGRRLGLPANRFSLTRLIRAGAVLATKRLWIANVSAPTGAGSRAS